VSQRQCSSVLVSLFLLSNLVQPLFHQILTTRMSLPTPVAVNYTVKLAPASYLEILLEISSRRDMQLQLTTSWSIGHRRGGDFRLEEPSKLAGLGALDAAAVEVVVRPGAPGRDSSAPARRPSASTKRRSRGRVGYRPTRPRRRRAPATPSTSPFWGMRARGQGRRWRRRASFDHRPRSRPAPARVPPAAAARRFESTTKSELPSEEAAARVPASSSRAVAVDLRRCATLARTARTTWDSRPPRHRPPLLTEKTNESGRCSARSRPQVRDPTARRDPA
jgi:hypothetical protein